MALRWLKFDIFASCRPKAEEELEVLQEEMQALRTENEGLRAENEGLCTENEGLRVENESLRKDNEGVSTENERIKAVLQRLGLERLSQEGVSQNTLEKPLVKRLSGNFRREIDFAIDSQQPACEMLTYSDVLGEGSFGTVAVAYAGERGYAIKIPREARHAEALWQEAQLMLRLPHHAHIVEIKSAYARGTDVSVALELGTYDMYQAVLNGRHTKKDLVRFMGDVAEGILHMHQHGMVHSDMKLENAIIFELAPGRFVAKVTDLGCAFYMGDIKPMNVGTLGTRPLESCLGNVVAATPQDVFSLGAMLAQVMVHRSLFRDNLFAHEALWDEYEKTDLMGLYGYERSTYLEGVSLVKMDDDGIHGFRMGMIKPSNMAQMPTHVEEEVCVKMRSYVDPFPDLRPSVEDFLTFTRNLTVHVT